MQFKILFLLFFVSNLMASSDSSLRVTSGVATDYDFGQILMGKIGKFYKDSTFYGLDYGHLVQPANESLPFDFYLKGGITYFEQNPALGALYEMTLYIKAYYHVNSVVRFGVGEGGSYTTTILEVERKDALEYHDNNSYYLNYIDVSLDFDIGNLLRQQSLKALYLGVLLKHRSGIFGLINNVRHGGSNHIGFYIEKNF